MENELCGKYADGLLRPFLKLIYLTVQASEQVNEWHICVLCEQWSWDVIYLSCCSFGRGLFEVVISSVGSQKGNNSAEVYKVMPFLIALKCDIMYSMRPARH